MPVRLRPVREDELPGFIGKAQRGYAEDMERNAGVPPETAREKAERDVAALVPDGQPAEGQHLLVVEDEGSGDAVGRLWFAERREGERTVAWIYEIAIEEHFRGRGLGRQTMALLEEEVRALGLATAALNVFGANERARSLYLSLGYREVSVEMSKVLT